MRIMFLDATTENVVAEVSTEQNISWEAANAIAAILEKDLSCKVVIDCEDE